MANSRTKNVALNAAASLMTQVVMILLNFVSRTVFIRTLDIDYLGVSGLFSNVLTILSFAELGIGHAIVFSLYKPLAEHNKERLCSLMQLYKKLYLFIFGVVVVLGLSMIPFLDVLIKGEPHVKENIVVIYLFYLFSTAVSYLYVYKISIINADQKHYIATTVVTVASIIRVIGQIIILYLTHNFLLFLTIDIFFRIAGNLYCTHLADKMYPYIRNKPKPLPKEDTRKIFKDVKSMAAYKFGSIVVNSSDNVIISAMVSITTVGLVSNYHMLVLACKNIMGGITNAFTASLGNHNATATTNEKYHVFNKIFLITAWLYGLASVGIIVVSRYFVEVWIGKEFILSTWVVIALVSEFYVWGIHSLESHYRYTMGFFVKGRIAPILAAISNIGLSILFCSLWGVAGVFIATSVARILTYGVIDTLIIFKDGFHRNPAIYFVKNVGFLLLFIGIGLLSSWIVGFVPWHSWFGVIVQILMVVLLYNAVMVLLFYRTVEYKEVVAAAKGLLRVKINKNK